MYKNASGKRITEHPLLPTKQQCQLMDDLVQGMDLDAYAAQQAKLSGSSDEAEEEDE